MAEAAEVPTGLLQAVLGVGCMAGARATLVDVRLAVQTRVSWGAITAEAAHQVHTGAVVQAPEAQVRGWTTVILVDLTVRSWGE